MKNPLHCLTLFALIFFLIGPSYALALTPYQPVVPVEIMTEANAGDLPGSQPMMSQMIIRPADQSSEAVHIGFFRTAPEQAIGTLTFLASGTVMWDAVTAASKQFQADNLLIIPGLTIPVDVLPVHLFPAGAEPAVFEFHRQAGGRTFVDRIRVSAYAVSSDQALQAQWIRIKGEVPPQLRMIEVNDLQTGKLIVRQLWAPGSAWWLYEQTPFRCSWRIQ